LPLAEAAGYAIAIGLLLIVSGVVQELPAALPGMKAVAAAWLLYSAARLWTSPVLPDLPDRRGALRRVFVTTLLNPKAMLVGTIMIPTLLPDEPGGAVALFIALSIIAGGCWIGLGAALPERLRRHSYKGAAVIIAGFAFQG
jgi:threonine/homoserine/homoserine lactone efflux protein